MTNVFCDFHHGELYYSLHLLFEKRLGWNLYCPVGMDWFHEGFWRIAEPYGNYPGTVMQFLGTSGYTEHDGVYFFYDDDRKYWQKSITLARFKEMPIDIVISSYGPHDNAYEQLVRDFKPKAKHVAQVGNVSQLTHIKNAMYSTLPIAVPQGQHSVFYHQEFPLEIFCYRPPERVEAVASFVMLLPERALYEWYKEAMPDFAWGAYGVQCPEGIITGIGKIAAIMQRSGFGWHLKPGGDGFGHIIHNWYACGRPVICKKHQYDGKLAGLLMKHGETCIDLDKFTNNHDAITAIRYCAQPDNHAAMCERTYQRFKSLVDFDEDARAVQKFMEGLL